MKKKIVPILITALCLLAAILVACQRPVLSAPANVAVNDQEVVSWKDVVGARGYTVVALTAEDRQVAGEWTVRRTNVSLAAELQEGDYLIAVRSKGDGKRTDDSEWSEEIAFHKNNGCIYTAIDNGTAYQVTRVGTATGVVVIEDEYLGKPITRIATAAFKGTGKVTEVVIGNNVKVIDENAFYNCFNLEKVTLPQSLTTIGTNAFNSCRLLKEVVVPQSVTVINDLTFAYCNSLENLVLPDSITSIGESAFSHCTSLKQLTLPANLTTLSQGAFYENTSLETLTLNDKLTTLDENVFYGCTSLKQINFSAKKVLTSISTRAFSHCSALESVTLPEGLEDIGESAFVGCTALDDVTIPSTVNHVGPYAFNATKLYTDVTAADGNFIYADGWLVAARTTNLTGMTEIVPDTFASGTRGIADRVFYANNTVETVTLPSSVKIVGRYAFAYDSALTKFEANGLELLDNFALAYSALRNPVLGEGLKTIGDYAFFSCTDLANNTNRSIIPSTVTRIGSGAFLNTAMYNDADAGSVVYAGRGSVVWAVDFKPYEQTTDWLGMTENQSYTVELQFGETENVDQVYGIADNTFANCTGLTSVSNLFRANIIGRAAFYNCQALDGVVLNSSLTKIEPYTFAYALNIGSIAMPRALTSIGDAAFLMCSRISRIDLSSTRVSSIGDFAFMWCSNAMYIDIDQTRLNHIGDYAFYGCENVREIVVPDNVTEIGGRAFSHCTALESVELGSGVESIGQYAFDSCTALTEITLPSSLQSIGGMAFYKCTRLRTVNILDGLQAIPDYAFYGCVSLTYVRLPDTLQSIGNYSFSFTRSLSGLTLPESVDEVGVHAFNGSGATFYLYGESVPETYDDHWNSSFLCIVSGCEFDANDGYVTSVTVSEQSLQNVDISILSAPIRDGYVFIGWSEEEGSPVVKYTADELQNAPVGTKLYSVWRVKVAYEDAVEIEI